MQVCSIVVEEDMSMLKKQPLKSKPVCKVTFTLPEAVKAENAYLVGDFNDWDEKATEMKKLKKNGQFSAKTMLAKIAPAFHSKFPFF